jgi:Uma2 family endonuclease
MLFHRIGSEWRHACSSRSVLYSWPSTLLGPFMEKIVSTSIEARLTPEEYLRLERLTDRKNEFFDGEVIPMPGVSRYHNRINRDLIVEIMNQFAGRPCEVFFCEMRVKIVATNSYAYPDVAILCGGAAFEDANVDTLLNPQVIIEILSESTEAHDRGRKLQHYRSIESLREYLLVSQSECRIEHYARQTSGEWIYSDMTDPQGTIALNSVVCRLSLEKVYRSITFETEK